MKHSQPRILTWDSEFFGYNVGRIDVTDETPEQINRGIEELKESQCALIYVFSSKELDFSRLNEKDAVLADIKRTYINRNPKPEDGIARHVVESFEGDGSELYDLGIQAGVFSRYNFDPRIPDDDFRRLYRLWIDNSVNEALADYVLVCRIDGKPEGLVTARLEDKAVSLPLLAVNRDMRGRGVGKTLVNEILRLGSDRGLPVEVVTQARNKPACALYESLGFEILDESLVYHLRPGLD